MGWEVQADNQLIPSGTKFQTVLSIIPVGTGIFVPLDTDQLYVEFGAVFSSDSGMVSVARKSFDIITTLGRDTYIVTMLTKRTLPVSEIRSKALSVFSTFIQWYNSSDPRVDGVYLYRETGSILEIPTTTTISLVALALGIIGLYLLFGRSLAPN